MLLPLGVVTRVLIEGAGGGSIASHVVGLVTAGYFLGNLPWVQANLSKIIWALILVPGLIVLWGAWKARRASAHAVKESA